MGTERHGNSALRPQFIAFPRAIKRRGLAASFPPENSAKPRDRGAPAPSSTRDSGREYAHRVRNVCGPSSSRQGLAPRSGKTCTPRRRGAAPSALITRQATPSTLASPISCRRRVNRGRFDSPTRRARLAVDAMELLIYPSHLGGMWGARPCRSSVERSDHDVGRLGRLCRRGKIPGP
jgi:hypothetical protein